MRKAQAKKLPLAPDPKFNDKQVTRFVNCLMWGGNKTVVLSAFYDALDNVTPAVEVRSRRIGGATFQIPSEVRPDRKISLSMKWLIRFSRERNGRSMSEKLSNEIIAASKGEGAAFKKKEDTHRMAEANKAFAHFRV